MSLKIGIVGLPNVGKSTLFNALLKEQAALAANYPFATIEPNVGVVPVRDERLEVLAKVIADGMQNAESKMHNLPPIKYATVEFVDIAGLVKGASEGEGLGNKFLANIRETDLIAHVVRDFSDENVIREGSSGALEDKETIEMELLLADLSTLEKQREPKASKDKIELQKWAMILKFKQAASEGKQLRTIINTEEEQRLASELNLLTAKKVLYVINIDESQVRESDSLIAKYAGVFGVHEDQIVIISAKIESELSSLSDEDQKMYLEDLGLKQSGLERMIAKAYHLLGLQSFLTAGEIEVRAWTIHQGTLAPQAAGVIHTDFEQKFIKAKVASFEDFVKYKGWKGVGENGRLRLEGKDYVMRDGDVVEFMIGK